MPSSKRNKLVTLSKVKKKNRDWKGSLITTVHKLLEDYPHVYLFKYQNMRNDKFKELRERVKADGKFCMGSNKVLKVALGKSKTDEHKTNLHLLAEHIEGNVGLFFTTLDRVKVVEIFDTFQAVDYARAGGKATEDFELLEGPLEGPLGPLQHTLEPTLRKNGVPTKLNKGVVEAVCDHMVCSVGDRLTAQQAAVLRIFDVKMAVFKMRLVAAWDEDGTVEMLGGVDDLSDEDGDGGDEHAMDAHE